MNGVIKIPKATPITEKPNIKPDAEVVGTYKGTLKYVVDQIDRNANILLTNENAEKPPSTPPPSTPHHDLPQRGTDAAPAANGKHNSNMALLKLQKTVISSNLHKLSILKLQVAVHELMKRTADLEERLDEDKRGEQNSVVTDNTIYERLAALETKEEKLQEREQLMEKQARDEIERLRAEKADADARAEKLAKEALEAVIEEKALAAQQAQEALKAANAEKAQALAEVERIKQEFEALRAKHKAEVKGDEDVSNAMIAVMAPVMEDANIPSGPDTFANVNRVLQSRSAREILDLPAEPEPLSKEQIHKAFMAHSILVHPDKLRQRGVDVAKRYPADPTRSVWEMANQAFRRVRAAEKELLAKLKPNGAKTDEDDDGAFAEAMRTSWEPAAEAAEAAGTAGTANGKHNSNIALLKLQKTVISSNLHKLSILKLQLQVAVQALMKRRAELEKQRQMEEKQSREEAERLRAMKADADARGKTERTEAQKALEAAKAKNVLALAELKQKEKEVAKETEAAQLAQARLEEQRRQQQQLRIAADRKRHAAELTTKQDAEDTRGMRWLNEQLVGEDENKRRELDPDRPGSQAAVARAKMNSRLDQRRRARSARASADAVGKEVLMSRSAPASLYGDLDSKYGEWPFARDAALPTAPTPSPELQVNQQYSEDLKKQYANKLNQKLVMLNNDLKTKGRTRPTISSGFASDFAKAAQNAVNELISNSKTRNKENVEFTALGDEIKRQNNLANSSSPPNSLTKEEMAIQGMQNMKTFLNKLFKDMDMSSYTALSQFLGNSPPQTFIAEGLEEYLKKDKSYKANKTNLNPLKEREIATNIQNEVNIAIKKYMSYNPSENDYKAVRGLDRDIDIRQDYNSLEKKKNVLNEFFEINEIIDRNKYPNLIHFLGIPPTGSSQQQSIDDTGKRQAAYPVASHKSLSELKAMKRVNRDAAARSQSKTLGVRRDARDKASTDATRSQSKTLVVRRGARNQARTDAARAQSNTILVSRRGTSKTDESQAGANDNGGPTMRSRGGPSSGIVERLDNGSSGGGKLSKREVAMKALEAYVRSN